MRIKGIPSTTTIRHIGKGLSFAYRSDGTAIVKRYPPSRPGKLAPTTESQVALWDDALNMAKFSPASQRAIANDLADGSGFYERDVLIAAAYGHMVSWPGWGIYPQGPTGQPLYLTSKGLPSFPRRAADDPQPINALSAWAVTATHDAITVDASTFHTCSPLLLRFCCDPDRITITSRRRGQRIPHGYKLFFPCDPTVYAPITGRGTSHVWDLPVADFDPPCTACKLVVVEEGAQPLLNFTSMPEDCPTRPPPPVKNWFYLLIASESCCGSAGNPCDPPTDLSPDLATQIARIQAAGYTVDASGVYQIFSVGPAPAEVLRYYAWGVPAQRPADVTTAPQLPGLPLYAGFTSPTLYDPGPIPDVDTTCNVTDPANYFEVSWVRLKA